MDSLSNPSILSIPSSEVTKRSVLPLVLAILVVLAAVGTAGYFAWQNNQQKKQIEQQSQDQVTLFPPVTNDWETYTSEMYNYSINFPHPAELRDRKPIDWEMFIAGISILPNPNNKVVKVSILIYSNKYTSPEKLINKNYENKNNWIKKMNITPSIARISSVTELSISNRPAKTFSYFVCSDDLPYCEQIQFFTTRNNEFVYELIRSYPINKETDKPLEINADQLTNQILSTFKFLD